MVFCFSPTVSFAGCYPFAALADGSVPPDPDETTNCTTFANNLHELGNFFTLVANPTVYGADATHLTAEVTYDFADCDYCVDESLAYMAANATVTAQFIMQTGFGPLASWNEFSEEPVTLPFTITGDPVTQPIPNLSHMFDRAGKFTVAITLGSETRQASADFIVLATGRTADGLYTDPDGAIDLTVDNGLADARDAMGAGSGSRGGVPIEEGDGVVFDPSDEFSDALGEMNEYDVLPDSNEPDDSIVIPTTFGNENSYSALAVASPYSPLQLQSEMAAVFDDDPAEVSIEVEGGGAYLLGEPINEDVGPGAMGVTSDTTVATTVITDEYTESDHSAVIVGSGQPGTTMDLIFEVDGQDYAIEKLSPLEVGAVAIAEDQGGS